MKITRSKRSSHRTCSATSRWPWWIGSNVPPIKPTRAIVALSALLCVASWSYRQDLQDLPAARTPADLNVEYITGPELLRCAAGRAHGPQLVRQAGEGNQSLKC